MFSRGSGTAEYEPILRQVYAAAPGDMRSWEGRKTPDAGQVEAAIRSFGTAALNTWAAYGPNIDLGLLFHADRRVLPRRNSLLTSNLREWYTSTTRLAKEISAFIDRCPWSLAILRGVDVCGDELSVPTWAVVPFFRLVTAGAHDAAARVEALIGAKPVFGRTAHAGEDYRTPIEGVRRIWELIEHEIVQDGDRIGHCLALFDTERWNDRALQPKHERLDDLLWLLGQPGARAPALSRPIRREAKRLIEELYPKQLRGVEDHLAAQRLRFDDAFVREEMRYDLGGVPECPAVRAAAIVWYYLFDSSVQETGAAHEWVTMSNQEQQLLKNAVRSVQALIRKRGIVLESNPTSNHFVRAGLSGVLNHPITAPEARGMMVSLSTDDPTFFATTLAEEHGRAAQMLTKAKRRRRQERCLALATAGLKSKFTIDAGLAQKILQEHLVRPAHGA